MLTMRAFDTERMKWSRRRRGGQGCGHRETVVWQARPSRPAHRVARSPARSAPPHDSAPARTSTRDPCRAARAAPPSAPAAARSTRGTSRSPRASPATPDSPSRPRLNECDCPRCRPGRVKDAAGAAQRGAGEPILSSVQKRPARASAHLALEKIGGTAPP